MAANLIKPAETDKFDLTRAVLLSTLSDAEMIILYMVKFSCFYCFLEKNTNVIGCLSLLFSFGWLPANLGVNLLSASVNIVRVHLSLCALEINQ